jgi:predicted HD superfamily hydrolase involved in NAD metabolism
MNSYYEKIVVLINPHKTLIENCEMIYNLYGKQKLFEHVRNVSNIALELVKFREIPTSEVIVASYLHDIGCIIDMNDYKQIVVEEKIKLLEEEKKHPILLHQKISKDIAIKCFGIETNSILSAIECHTTLKSNPSLFDMILFIADKLEWDQSERPEYLNSIERTLKYSIEEAVKQYLVYKMEHKETMLAVHPWMFNAYNDLCLQAES